MSKQLALSIAVSVLAMVSFVLLGQQAGVQLAEDARGWIPIEAGFTPPALFGPLLPPLQ